MFLLRCPKCRNTMKYEPSDGKLDKKIKRCVYCGHSMSVKKVIVERI